MLLQEHFKIPEMYILDVVGFFGPIILLFISIMQLLNQRAYLIGYLVFFACNILLNSIVKLNVKQDRPINGRNIIPNESYSGVNKYGMPSSHAQSVFFSLTYLHLVKDLHALFIIELFICALTLYQRWNYRRHTTEQLCVGALLGICMAYIGVFITKQWLISVIPEKIL